MISFRPFRELVRKRNISTYFLRNKCGDYNLDSKTIQRLMADQSVSTHTVDALCHILDCGPEDIMEFVPEQADRDAVPQVPGGGNLP